MSFLHSLISAFSCFSAIPMPTVAWRDDSMRYMMALLPLVGAAIGLAMWAWLWLCDAAALGDLLRAVGVVLVPVAVTGGIHLDGFCDVVDAQSSHASPERKREILKDPHAGAFAIIGLGCYLLLYLGLASELPRAWQLPAVLGSIYVLERALSVVAVVTFPKSSKKGMMAAQDKATNRTPTLVLTAAFVLLALAVMAWASVAAAVVSAVVGAACLVWLRVFSDKEFGGFSGDLGGVYIQVCEIALVAGVVVVAKVVGL